MYADIIVDLSIDAVDRTFQYIVPREWEDTIKVGMTVCIPFGKGNRMLTGFIIGLSSVAQWPVEKMKYIAEVKEKDVAVESQLIQLAAWIRKRYGATMNEALKTVLPVKKQIKSVEEHWLNFVVTKDAVEKELQHCKERNFKAKIRLLEGLLAEGGRMTTKLASSKYKVTKSVIDGYVQKGIIEIRDQRQYRNPVETEQESIRRQINLNDEQSDVLEKFKHQYKEKPSTYLLYGVTGSGKTEVYIEMIRYVIAEGKQAIVLIPEIALTKQTVDRFVNSLGERVTILNSRMSDGEKYDQYERVKRGEVDIVIGPRSALFVPFDKLGLIIVDEEHETSYKSEMPPKYHAREVAIQRASMAGASVVLGSATPSMESYQAAADGKYTLLTMKKRAKDAVMPTVHVVDLREELAQGNRSVFSRLLQQKIKERIQKKEQVMLFLNRRGYAGFVSCRSCGYVLKCNHCDISMTAHKTFQGDVDMLKCHYCGHAIYMPKTCPECGSPYIAAFGLGTQKVEEMLQKLIPEAKTLRMDGDTTTGKQGHEQVLAPFRRGDADVLIGTQMIVKGHDFPNVTLVAALAADMGMYANDFRSTERTFDLLMQASGRAGRGDKPGEMIVQTYNPEQYCIEAVKLQNADLFYENERAYRRLTKYPPFVKMMLVLVLCEVSADAKGCIEELAQTVAKEEGADLIGPSEAGLSRAKDRYRYVMYIKAEEYGLLENLKTQMEEKFKDSKWARNCSVQYDMDPMNGY